jgi:Domain of unknown function (DUF4349)
VVRRRGRIVIGDDRIVMNVGMCRGTVLSNVVTMTRVSRSLLIGTALLISALTLTGCSASGSSSAPGPQVAGGSGQSEAVAPDTSDGSAVKTGGSAASVDRSIVVTGTLTVTAEKPLEAADKAVSIVEAAGGRVDGRTENAATDGDRGSATLVLRIPAAKLTPTLNALKKLGRADQVEVDATDVTTQTQDLGARIDALRASVTRLLQLEAKATDTTNLIAIETAISDRQGELESLEAQQRGLNDQISMSTITLSLRSDAAAPPVKPVNFLTGLGAGWGAFVAFWAGALVVFGVLLPWLVFLAIATAATLIIVRIVGRRSARRAAAGSAPTTPPPPIG